MTTRSSDVGEDGVKAEVGRRGWSAAAVSSLLPARCVAGRLTIGTPSGHAVVCDSDRPGPNARIDVRRWRGLTRMLLGGNVGFAQAFMDGDCDCTDLAQVFGWVLANEECLSGLGSGSILARLAGRLRHRRNANTLRGSRRNIAAHYDLGNAFYAAWLDRGMSYSSAIYADGTDEDLESAQEAKLDRVVELLGLGGGERILEIGCGWGALAERLARDPAADVTCLTLSQRQRDYTVRRLAQQAAGGRADVRLQDYREVEGQFDRIVSIEMLEAVGQRYWPVYFDTLQRRLVPGGTAVVQVITIRDDRFETYVREPDFIQRYVFPGGMLPTTGMLQQEGSRAGLSLKAQQMFGLSYARTLAAWRERFEAAWPELQGMGFDERFGRMWRYYLSYCEVGFRTGELDVGLYTFWKAD